MPDAETDAETARTRLYAEIERRLAAKRDELEGCQAEDRHADGKAQPDYRHWRDFAQGNFCGDKGASPGYDRQGGFDKGQGFVDSHGNPIITDSKIPG